LKKEAKTFVNFSASVVAGSVLAGCDLAPRYHVPVVAVPVSYEEAAHWKRAAPADGFPRGAWWEIYHDPVLNGLEARVDKSNPDLQGAAAVYDQARALAAEAAAGLFPNLGVGANISANRQSNRRPLRGAHEPNQYMANGIDAQAGYEIDIWDKVAN
jgi:outer membrane protein TolC